MNGADLMACMGDLAKLLADGGMSAYTVKPEAPTDDDYPLCYVVGADPFVSYEAGWPDAHVDIVLITKTGTDTETMTKLLELIAQASDLVAASSDYTVNTITRPGHITLDNSVHLAAAIETVRPLNR